MAARGPTAASRARVEAARSEAEGQVAAWHATIASNWCAQPAATSSLELDNDYTVLLTDPAALVAGGVMEAACIDSAGA